jgi:hypothetical protein
MKVVSERETPSMARGQPVQITYTLFEVRKNFFEASSVKCVQKKLNKYHHFRQRRGEGGSIDFQS